jgi:predicted metal-dependent peptidase
MSDEKVQSDYIFDTASDEEAAKFRLSPHLINLMSEEPFFSSLIRQIRREKTSQIPTAGVTCIDGSLALYWNPKFLASLSADEIKGLIKHECYHLIFKHCTARKQTPHQMWNMATDLAINSLIAERLLPKGGLIPGKALNGLDKITDPNQYAVWKRLSDLICGFPKNKNSEWYMAQLMNDEELQEAMDKLPKDCSGGVSSGMPGMDDHDGWGEGLSEEEKAKLENEIKEAVSKAGKEADRSNSWGSVSQETRKLIRKTYESKVNWKNVLTSFVGRRQRAKKSSTHRRINRKYPYIHPGKKIGHQANLAVYIDQSGSISDRDIAMFTGTLVGLAKNVTFTFYNFDTRVDERSKQVWRKGKKSVQIKRTVCGGTCFDCVEDHFRKNLDTFDGYITLTDGCAAKPKPCKLRRCWVLLPGYKLYFQADKTDTVVTMD